MARDAVDERSAKNKRVSEKVVSAVAEETGSDPLALEPLYSVVEPDALDTFFEMSGLGPRRSPFRIEFTYSGCEIMITGDGSVSVSESDQGN